MFLLLQSDLLNLSSALCGWNLPRCLQLNCPYNSSAHPKGFWIYSVWSGRYINLKVGMLCMLVSLTHPNLIVTTCHLFGYVLMYISDSNTVHYTLTYFRFSISFWLTNFPINDGEHPSSKCTISMANYFAFLSSAFLSPKMIKSSPKHSSMHLSSQLN